MSTSAHLPTAATSKPRCAKRCSPPRSKSSTKAPRTPAMPVPAPRATAPISGCASPPRCSPASPAWRGIGLCMMRCNFSSHRASTPLPSRRSERVVPTAPHVVRRQSTSPIPHEKTTSCRPSRPPSWSAPFPCAALAQNVAIVNGKAVPKARMDVLAQQLAAAGRPVTPEMQSQLREEVIAREVFMQEAQKQGLDATDDYKNQLELARQAILIRAAVRELPQDQPGDRRRRAGRVRQVRRRQQRQGIQGPPHPGRDRRPRPRRSWPT